MAETNDPHCRGVVLLGLNAAEDELRRGFQVAARQPLCKGFAVGRGIFLGPAEAWFAGEADDAATVEAVAGNYRRLIDIWRENPAS
jgi:5-dehydro-2-deoxygluconokinase